MPKRVPKEAKRVPLNCLISPATRDMLKDMKCSQGEAVDQWAAAYKTLNQPRVRINISELSGVPNYDPRTGKLLSGTPFKFKRGPRPKGDKTR